MSGLRFSYVTNGLVGHRLDDALELLAEHGYAGVAVTLDHHHLDPYARDLDARLATLAVTLERLGLAVVVETGARFLLDPRRKHEPTLLSDESGPRVDMLLRAVAVAADLGAEAVSLWSGTPAPGLPSDEAWRRLLAALAPVVEAATARGVRLAFEPEPGMLIATMDDLDRLGHSLGWPGALGVTLDIGHCACLGEPVAAAVERAGPRLANVHVEDMRRGVHEHLDFGEGDVDVPGALAALAAAGYGGLVSVELSRHSHVAHETVPRAIAFLRAAERASAVA